jgi:Glu-tRNA(Gln) amidotransferase subunit E-like FAD-binding protein
MSRLTDEDVETKVNEILESLDGIWSDEGIRILSMCMSEIMGEHKEQCNTDDCGFAHFCMDTLGHLLTEATDMFPERNLQ